MPGNFNDKYQFHLPVITVILINRLISDFFSSLSKILLILYSYLDIYFNVSRNYMSSDSTKAAERDFYG